MGLRKKGEKPALRVRFGHLLAWCGPSLPVAAIGLPLVVYLPAYYAGTLGLPLSTVGFIFAAVRLIDIPFDPLIGGLMDNSRTRLGQFRPWMLGGGLILMLGVYLLFMPQPGVSALQLFASLFILYLGYSCVFLAQTAWGARLSSDYGERARIFGWWTAFNMVGTLLVLIIPPLVSGLVPGATVATGIEAMGWFILLLIPLTTWIAALAVPEGEAPVESAHGVRLADARVVLADPRMQRLLLVDLALSVLSGITGALFLFFFMAARGLPAAAASQLLLFYFLAGLLAAPLWVRLARRFGKHRATALAAIWLGLSQLLIVLMPSDAFVLAAIGMALAGVAFAAPVFLLRAMLADLCDAQALDRLDKNMAPLDTTGLCYALLTATAKLGYAIPVGLLYPILSLIGFDPKPGAANSESAIAGLELLFIGPPMLLAALAAFAIWRWPITAEAHSAIRARMLQGAR